MNDLGWIFNDKTSKLSIKLHTDDDMFVFINDVCKWMERDMGHWPEYKEASIILFKALIVYNGTSRQLKSLDSMAELEYEHWYGKNNKSIDGMSTLFIF